ncbi:MAG: Holliday junction resolvase RuvX [Clostridiales bacterium]|nr:Holliday junction resolvase RuvX [Clostridiales bacterium]
MKAMGIDFGMARIGVALSDDTMFLASPFQTYKRKDIETDLNYFANLIKEKNVSLVVCGLPMNMQGEEQEIAKKTREFMAQLKEKIDFELEFFDERLTSSIAEDILRETEKDWKKRKEKLDMVAASIILQDYLDMKR